MESDGTDWTGKRIFLRTSNNTIFQGRVVFEDERFISLIDKFGNSVKVLKTDIILLKEEGNRNGL